VKKNRLVLSDAAVADIIEQAEWYSTQSGTALAGRRALGEGGHLRHTARSESPDNRNAVHISIFGTPQCATNCDAGDSPSIRFSTGLTPERYSSSAWYTARETWNVCYRFIRARGAPSAWGTLFWGLALLIISIPEVPRRSSNGGKGPVPELYMSMASALPNLP
jgi:hypothetical protein